jgi:nucleotide-binding universal stress UspA family protein
MVSLHLILHPTDFSEAAEYAFHLACSLAREHGGRVLVLHVAIPPVVGYGGVMTAPPEGDWKALQGRLQQIQSPEPRVPVEHRLIEGNPVAEILRVAQETKCDLIAMGTQGRSGLARLLMGSVVEQVVRRAPCPVLTVRGPLPETVSP